MFDFLKKEKEVQEVEMTPIEVEYDAGVKSLASYSLDTEDYGKAVDNLAKVQKIMHEEQAHRPEEKQKWYKELGGRVMKLVTHPSVLATAISVGVAYIWGDRCMRYDADGNVPPNRMFNNGPSRFSRVDVKDE